MKRFLFAVLSLFAATCAALGQAVPETETATTTSVSVQTSAGVPAGRLVERRRIVCRRDAGAPRHNPLMLALGPLSQTKNKTKQGNDKMMMCQNDGAEAARLSRHRAQSHPSIILSNIILSFCLALEEVCDFGESRSGSGESAT